MRHIHFPHIECSTSASGMEIMEPERQEGDLVVDGALCVCDYCKYYGSLVPDEKFRCYNCGKPRLE